MSEELLDLAIATTGGLELWNSLGALKIDISIGGPIWAMKGWPPETSFDQVLTVDTSPSTNPACCSPATTTRTSPTSAANSTPCSPA